ncbi:MAG: resuscitation-promoting factor RpfB [Actinomycetota bacterium]|nr:resuscitation-promoting factor RpfB [Actinomycetota bacterium]
MSGQGWVSSPLMRRPGRPRASVERSFGVAEHHAFTGLTRLHVTRLVAVACVGALGILPAVPAHATTPAEQIAATGKAIDVAAQRWFTAQADATRIDANIADVEHRIEVAQARIAYTRKIATARAVVLYKNADIGITSMLGDNALDSARRAHLANDANAGGDAAIAALTTAVDDLKARRHDLEAARAEQRQVLADVSAERHSLDAALAGVRAVARRQAQRALAGAHDRAAQLRATARVHTLASLSAPAADQLAPPTAPPILTVPAPTVVGAPANGRVSAHHDDPFLVCTRARESAGQYGVVSPSGYYGAYQFLPSTWDTTAMHAGRSDLVGVLPSHAGEYDQDEMAWVLYQWQGKSPWGGRC